MLKLDNVTISYKNVPTVQNFNLDMKEGQIVSLVGESGSGKTTVIRAVLGLLAGGGKVRTVDDIISRNIVCAAPKDNIHDAALKMSEFGVRRLPVVENEKLAGMLSLKDLASKRIFTAEIGHIIYNVCNKKP